MKKLSLLAAFIALSTVLSAHAANVSVSQVSPTENKDGNLLGSIVVRGGAETIFYELVPATAAIEAQLKGAKCAAIDVSGSVLSRSYEIDHENQTDAVETVKFLVRAVTGCAK